jgi:Druantia protein DruA
MELPIRYRGRQASSQEVALIRRLIAENPDDSRRALSVKLCKALNWVQPNGALRDMVCRGYMLALHRAGYIRLPAKKCSPPNPFIDRKKPGQIGIDQSPISTGLKNIRPLRFQQVRRSRLEKLYNSLVEAYHYLGYCQPVGEHLKYIVFAGQRPVGCLAWSSAARHIGCRDRFIGWSAEYRRKHIHLIAYNTRFLILPWVRVPYLASHILAQMAKAVAADWQRIYNHRVYYLETFVDKDRFAGSCYKAANWIYLGDTTGRGKNDQSKKPNRSIKAVYGYPLIKNFRKHLCAGPQ